MAQLSPRQLRNQKGQTALPRPVPGPVPSDCLSEVRAAMGAAGRDNAARQSDAARWMDHGPAAPAVSGDRQPTKVSHAGHVGAILGQGVHPAASPPGELWRQPERLPPMPPPPAPMAVAATRPALATGWWHGRRPAEGGPEFVAISPEIAGPDRRSGGLLARLARWFKGGGE